MERPAPASAGLATRPEDQAVHLARLRWRCRRGMRELDVVMQRYLERRYAAASAAERSAFETLVEQQDPLLLAYLMGREQPDDPEQRQVLAVIGALMDES